MWRVGIDRCLPVILIVLSLGRDCPSQAGKYEHIQAEEARSRHVRPQDANKPVMAVIPKGTRVSFETHAAHAGIGMVGSPLGTCRELEGLSLSTHEGRGQHADEVRARRRVRGGVTP